MKKLLLFCLLSVTLWNWVGPTGKAECPTRECLDHGCKVAEMAVKLQIPESNWREFGRQVVSDEFCGDLVCCCADHR